MAGYGVKKMNWVRNPSAYQSMVSWREKHKAFQEKFEANNQNTVAALQTAWVDVGLNIGQIAANRAMARIQQEFKAKQEQRAIEATAQLEINAPKQSAFSYNDSVTVTGGATINLAANTITHSDGSVVDLKTGLKVNVTA